MDECLACLGDFSMRKRRERADGDTRSEAIVSGVGRFLTHFVRPFSIAHLLGRAGGIWLLFTFRQRLVFLPVLSYPYLRSLISFPFTRGVGISGMAWGDTPRRVGGVIWLLVPRPVPSSRSAARSISPYRLAGRMRAPFLSAHSSASFIGGWSYRFPFRLVPRLACPSRVGVSCLFFAARLSIRFISSICWRLVAPFRPAVPALSSCSSFLDISPCPAPRSPSRAIRLARSSRQAARVLFSLGRLVSAARMAGRVLVSSILFSSHSSAASHGHWDGRRFVSPMPRGGVLSSRLSLSWNPIG